MMIGIFKKKWKKTLSRNKRNKAKGQSLVEITLTFPVLLLLLSGLVEFGFMLNYYLSLNDASRETARLFSNFDPFDEAGQDNLTGFYAPAADFLLNNLEPINSNDTSRKIDLDPNADDVIISVFSVSNGVPTRYPRVNGGEYRKYDNHVSLFDNAEVESRLIDTAPDTGVLLVEVFYDYHQVLKLPWLAFIPDPMTLHGYTMMPLSAAEPTPTPVP